jgi:choline dehydrogenase-like flavoprotein
MRDVIVIGAGGGGPVVAKELAERGLDVLLLEAGAPFDDPEAEWSRIQSDANNPLSGYLRFGPADRSKPAWVRETNTVISQVSGIGGTTTHYYGNSPRAMPGAFQGYAGPDAEAYDRAHEFPFSYKSFVPYYEWVEETLPVQTAAMGTKEEVFFRAAEQIGLSHQTSKDITSASFRPQENAILQPGGNAGRTSDPLKLIFPKATGCTFCGHCLQGCVLPRKAPRNLKAKRSTDNSYVPMALTADRWSPHGKPVTLVTDAFATRVHTEPRDGGVAAAGVTWRVGATGEEVTEQARVVVMAGGCIETPRLWLKSELPNPNGWVGRGVTTHFLDLVIGLLPFDAQTSKGPGSAARADYPGRGSLEHAGGLAPGLLTALQGASDGGISGFYDNGLPATGGADSSGRLLGLDLKEVFFSEMDSMLFVLPLVDDHVEAQNRVTLSSAFPPDEHGAVPRVQMAQRGRAPRTLENREFLTEQAVRIARAAGATRVHRVALPDLVIHVQSSMRMGHSENDSVLDPSGEARWVKRLFVADNSALANAIGGPNPTLTTQALATRTAEKIFRTYFGGDPWVKEDSPVSSIDDRVSTAVQESGIA